MRPVSRYDLQSLPPQASFCLRVSRRLCARRLPLRRFARGRNLSTCDAYSVAHFSQGSNNFVMRQSRYDHFATEVNASKQCEKHTTENAEFNREHGENLCRGDLMGRPSLKHPGAKEGGEPPARPYPLDRDTVAGYRTTYLHLLRHRDTEILDVQGRGIASPACAITGLSTRSGASHRLAPTRMTVRRGRGAARLACTH